MGQTSEVAEPPAEFEYVSDYRQMDYDQPMFKVLPAEAIITYDSGPEQQALGCPHCTDNPFYGDIVGQMLPGYLQYPSKLVWMNPYQ